MKKTIMFFYDKDTDIMDISLGKPKAAISEEVNDDIIVRIDPNSREILGFTIINFLNVFLKRFATKKKPIELTLSSVTWFPFFMRARSCSAKFQQNDHNTQIAEKPYYIAKTQKQLIKILAFLRVD